MAHIGMGTQSFSELNGLLKEPQIQIVTVCDPNKYSTDYVEWGKHDIRNKIRNLLNDSAWGKNLTGCPGGRQLGKKVIDTFYAKNRSKEKFKACTSYADFRELLEKEKDIDAVKIMTPDHLHAAISIAAMKKGLHVLMHKPVANRLYEGRLVQETTRKSKVATRLLAYGAGTDNGLIAERIKQGIIGPLREIHNWSNRPFWPQYPEIPKDTPPVPDGFQWDLWLGPETDRPYHPHYTHAVFRGWYDFGGGSMADMGIYSLWPVFDALNLGTPTSAQARATHACSIANNVSWKIDNDFSYPIACALRFQFAPRQGMPALDLFWYDGGMKPRLPKELEKQDITIPNEAILFVGDKGSIMADFMGQQPRLFANGQNKPLRIDDRPSQNLRSLSTWIQAVKENKPSPGNFIDAGPITDTVNLGTVALRAGKKVIFDSEKMKLTNAPEAEKYFYRQYRDGWQL
jgi:predicted dehydrogenase